MKMPKQPILSLLFSGFAAGIAICASLLTEAYLRTRLPDAPWSELIVSLGYVVGFVIVILGKLQLFTDLTKELVAFIDRDRAATAQGD